MNSPSKLIILFALLKINFAAASSMQLQMLSSQTQFIAIGKPAMLRIKGEATNLNSLLQVENNFISGELQLELRNLQTGIEIRDSHMKEKYLEVGKYPLTKLKLENLELPNKLDQIHSKSDEKKFSGKLTLHGVTKEVDGTYFLEPESQNIKVNAQFNINLSDFRIDIPSYAGIKVADKVEILTSLTIKKQ